MGRSGGAQKNTSTKKSLPRSSKLISENKIISSELFNQFINNHGGQEGRAFKTLNQSGKLVRRNGQIQTRRGNIESMVEEGYLIKGESPKRLLKKDGSDSFFSEEDFTKTEFDYAGFLINQKTGSVKSSDQKSTKSDIDQEKLCNRCQEKRYDGPDMLCSTCRTRKDRELFRHRDQKPKKPAKAPEEETLPEQNASTSSQSSPEEDKILEEFGY